MSATQASSQPAATTPRLVTVDELAGRIGRNPFTVYHWLKEAPERLPPFMRLYGRVLFAEADVVGYIDAARASATSGMAPCPACGLSRGWSHGVAHQVATAAPVVAPKRKRGAPTKVERLAKASAAATTGGAA